VDEWLASVVGRVDQRALDVFNFFIRNIMGGKVSSFFNDVGQGLTQLWSDTQKAFIRPVLGESISNALGVEKDTGLFPMAEGGMVKGIKVIDTPAQLMALIKQFPEEAKANGLSVELVKQQAAKMARGGAVMARGRGGMAHGGVMGCARGGSMMDHGMSPMMYGGMKKGGKGMHLF